MNCIRAIYFTGGCTASAESTLLGRQVFPVWSIESGEWNGQNLAHSKIAVLETGLENLAEKGALADKATGNDQIRATLPGLAEAAAEVGSPQIRNVATLGGNLAQHSRCWYYRQRDLRCLKRGGNTCFALEGENKYHSLFSGNPCISPVVSNLAVILAALEARVIVRRDEHEVTWTIPELYAIAWDNPQERSGDEDQVRNELGPSFQHDRSQARSAWESVPPKNRPVGYGMIERSSSHRRRKCFQSSYSKFRHSNHRIGAHPCTNHTVPCGTALWGGVVPGTPCLATILSACPSGTKAIRPSKTRIKLAFMRLPPGLGSVAVGAENRRTEHGRDAMGQSS